MQLDAKKRRSGFLKTALWQNRGYSGSRASFQQARPGTGGERMRSSIASPQIGADMRPTYTSDKHNTRINQLNQQRTAQKAAVKKTWTAEGIRATLAYGIMIFLLVVFGCIFLFGRYQVVRAEMQNSRILYKVNETQRKCVSLREEIEASEANLFVGYAAVDLGLVSDNGVEKMKLTAPTDAIVLPQSVQTGSR